MRGSLCFFSFSPAVLVVTSGVKTLVLYRSAILSISRAGRRALKHLPCSFSTFGRETWHFIFIYLFFLNKWLQFITTILEAPLFLHLKTPWCRNPNTQKHARYAAYQPSAKRESVSDGPRRSVFSELAHDDSSDAWKFTSICVVRQFFVFFISDPFVIWQKNRFLSMMVWWAFRSWRKAHLWSGPCIRTQCCCISKTRSVWDSGIRSGGLCKLRFEDLRTPPHLAIMTFWFVFRKPFTHHLYHSLSFHLSSVSLHPGSGLSVSSQPPFSDRSPFILR